MKWRINFYTWNRPVQSGPFGPSGSSRTCSSLVWRGRSCWGPGTWPARRWAPSGGPRRWPGADWPHIHLQRSNRVTLTALQSFVFDNVDATTSTRGWTRPLLGGAARRHLVSDQFWCTVDKAEPHPSSSGAGRRPACIGLRGRCRARWEPEPETRHQFIQQKINFSASSN